VPGGVAVAAGVVAKTSLQMRSWLDNVALRSMEARDWGKHARWKRVAYSPSSLKVDVLNGEVVVRRSRVVVHRFVSSPSSPFVEHYAARRAHTLCPWVKNAVGLRALHVADEHPWSAPVVELADVAKLLAECEAAEDP
jgi:hypothetical protein